MNGDHVRVRHPCETYCEECGASYRWNTPVPIQVFVEGNKGFLRIHQDCPIYRQDWRQRLLRTMEARLWSVWRHGGAGSGLGAGPRSPGLRELFL
jgi:hypothetical protein